MRMKTRFFLVPMLVGLCSAALFCACDDTKPEAPPVIPPTPGVLTNAYEFNGDLSAIESNIQFWKEGAAQIILSPESGITDPNDLIGTNKEYVLIGFGGEVKTGNFDLTASDTPFGFTYMKDGKALFVSTPKAHSTIAFGNMEGIKDSERSATFNFTIMLSDETVFRGNFTASLEPEPDPAQPDNTIVLGEQTIAIQSIFTGNFNGYKTITLTPAKGVTTLEEIQLNDYDYFQVIVTPALLNKSFDVMTETEEFTIISLFDDPEFTIAPEVNDGITAGTCQYTIEDSKATLIVDITLEDGRQMSVRASCEVTPEPEMSEYISINDLKKPVRAAFYEIDPDGSVALFFSPGEIETFDELETTIYYISLMLDGALLDGTQRDIASLSEDFALFYVDNASGDMKAVETGNLEGATGTFSVKQDSEFEEIFTIELHFVLGDGTKIDLKYDDECLTTEAAEEKANEYIFNDNHIPINSVIVDKRNVEVYDIWLSGRFDITTIEEMQDYGPVQISCPAECFNGSAAGFSVYPDQLAIIFGPTVYNFANGNTGTVTPLLIDSELTLDFTTYGELSGHYKGPVTIIK